MTDKKQTETSRTNPYPATPAQKEKWAAARLKKYGKEGLKQIQWKYWLKQRNLTPAAIESMMVKQNRCCDLCGVPLKDVSKITLGRKNRQGRPLAIFCSRCGLLIGVMEKTPGLMVKAREYLKQHTKP